MGAAETEDLVITRGGHWAGSPNPEIFDPTQTQNVEPKTQTFLKIEPKTQTILRSRPKRQPKHRILGLSWVFNALDRETQPKPNF